MIFSLDNILLIGSILLLVAILSTKMSRFGVPIVILFIGLGMLAGSEGIGGIYFDNPRFTKFIGILALCVILFSGGLDTKYSDVKQVLWKGISLSTVGVLLTAGIMGILAHVIFHFSWIEGFLIGSIVSSTDAAAVFSILKSRRIGLKGNLRPLLEFESGSNDPMAYFLTLLFVSMLTARVDNVWDSILMFLQQMSIGAGVGFLLGNGMYRVINWIKLDFEGLYSVLLLGMVFFTFSFTEYLGGNSFLAVYLAGIILGNHEFVHKRSLTKHFDGQAWFMQIIMFLTLGLLVFPSQLKPLIWEGLIFSVALIFIARPFAVLLTLAPFRMNIRSKLFLSWVGLRGSVPIILAIYVLSYQVPASNLIFNLVFFVSISSVIIQGTSFPFVARWLHLIVPDELKRKSALDKEQIQVVKELKSIYTVPMEAAGVGKKIVDIGLPKEVIITTIRRNGKYLLVDGNFKLAGGDVIEIIADNENSVDLFARSIKGTNKLL